MIYISKNTEESESIGYSLAEKLHTGGTHTAFIAMRGEMGVGKTAFVRGFASYFGIKGVKSPTYSIVNEHRGKDASIFHFDMYRVESEDDLLSIGFYDYLSRRGYSIVEWSENIEEFLPDGTLFVTISRADDADARTIEISEDF
jgi:tRNA threonylcarbamoyladenosine biosynthesis protein TsaE